MPKEVRESDFTTPVKQYKDIDLCFRRNPVTGDIAVKENENAIKQALKNLMLTRPGERPFPLMLAVLSRICYLNLLINLPPTA